MTRRSGTAAPPAVAGSSWRTVPQPVLSPRDAFFAPRERVPADRAAGRVAAELVSPYPPGIPALVPGELITADLLEALRSEARAGTRMARAADPAQNTLLCVSAMLSPSPDPGQAGLAGVKQDAGRGGPANAGDG